MTPTNDELLEEIRELEALLHYHQNRSSGFSQAAVELERLARRDEFAAEELEAKIAELKAKVT